jgi:hypothetical protein
MNSQSVAHSTDAYRADLNGGIAAMRPPAGASRRRSCATSEVASSTLLPPLRGTVSQIFWEVTRQ